MKPLWIIGSGGHARVVIDTVRATGNYDVVGCLDDNPARLGTEVLGVPVVGPITAGVVAAHNIELAVIGIGVNAARHAVATRLDGQVAWATVVHPRATVAGSVTLGEGTVVFAGAVIQPDAVLGRHVICNTAASVDHDANLDDHAHLAPGCHLAGNVSIGEGAFLGIGSAVIPGARVGAWSVVGAGATVIRDLPANVIAVGTPARVIRHQARGWHLS